MKKYIVKQTVNWNQRGDKTATFTVPCNDDAELDVFLSKLDGKIEVYELNLTLSSADTVSTASTSYNCLDSIKMRLKGAETKYIAAYNRPIVLKASADLAVLSEAMKASIHPFEGAFVAELPQDVSFDTGDVRKL